MICGIGEMVLDVFHRRGTIEGCCGGGTVWNVLYNLAVLGHKTTAIGFCGADEYGQMTIKHLDLAGVDIRNVKCIKRMITNKVYVDLDDGNMSQTIAQCPICGRNTWRNHTYEYDSAVTEANRGILVIDSTKQEVIRKAREFLNNGWSVVQDIGRIGSLRYKSKLEIKEMLSNSFDVVQMEGKVSDFICKRYEFSHERDVLKFLGCRHLIVTRGALGANIYTQNREIFVEAPEVEKVVDTVGAGDAMLATYLHACIIDDSYICCDLPEKIDMSLVKDTVMNWGARREYMDMKPEDNCLCGKKEWKIVTNKYNKFRSNVRYILNRMLHSFESGAIVEIKELFSTLQGKRVLFIGTGGSFASAVYMSNVFCKISDNNISTALHPRAALQLGLNHFECVIVLSYSGKSNDIVQVLREAKKMAVPSVLISKAKQAPIEADNLWLISYSNSVVYNPLERGFISIAGVLVPVALTSYACVAEKYRYEEWYDLISKRFRYWSNSFSAWDTMDWMEPFRVDVFCDHDTLAAAYDLESKIVETGLGRVTIHDKKDFSHGRFSVLEYDCGNICIYYMNSKSQYEEMLCSYLESKLLSRFFLVNLQESVLDRCLEAMLFNVLWLNKICDDKNKDLSDPKLSKNSEGMKLYYYKGIIN